MNELLEQSREIVEKAIADIKPVAVIAMISGGNDSMAAYQVAKIVGVKIDFLMHGRTGTGIPETTEFVREFARNEGLPYIEADAGDSYERSVLTKGFAGRGQRAHAIMYHRLKSEHFKKAISKHIRQGQQNRPVLLLSGARKQESKNRAENIPNPVTKDPHSLNYWTAMIHSWDKEQRDCFLAECKAPCNPVTKAMCRSGECLCGTTQDTLTRLEASVLYPHWGKWLNDLENRVRANGFNWGWGEAIPKSFTLEKAGQQTFDDFLPMCVSCKVDEEWEAL